MIFESLLTFMPYQIDVLKYHKYARFVVFGEQIEICLLLGYVVDENQTTIEF